MPTNVSQLLSIIHRYNPENDTIPNGPRVTWAEGALADAVVALAEHIDHLQQQVDRLEAMVQSHEALTQRATPPEAAEFPHGEFPNYFELKHEAEFSGPQFNVIEDDGPDAEGE